tara:strand:- start:1061 stop:1588 length:528 start_codon:yes stop_codon:yes gene_type:complete
MPDKEKQLIMGFDPDRPLELGESDEQEKQLIMGHDPDRPLKLDESGEQYEWLIDKMRREAEIYGSPTARTLQQAGDILGTVPPIGLPGMAAQSAGDALYTGASGYLASQGVPGAAQETAGGLAALLSPIPRALISPGKRNMIRAALQELGISQVAQETGKYLGKAEQEEALKKKP